MASRRSPSTSTPCRPTPRRPSCPARTTRCWPTRRWSPTPSSRPAVGRARRRQLRRRAVRHRRPEGRPGLRRCSSGCLAGADGRRPVCRDPRRVGSPQVRSTRRRSTRRHEQRGAGSAPRDPARGGEGRLPVRHPGRWVAIVVIGVLVAMAVNSVVTNPSWDWPFQLEMRFSTPVLQGVATTLGDSGGDADGPRARRHPRRHAPVAQPGADGGPHGSTSGSSVARPSTSN